MFLSNVQKFPTCSTLNSQSTNWWQMKAKLTDISGCIEDFFNVNTGNEMNFLMLGIYGDACAV